MIANIHDVPLTGMVYSSSEFNDGSPTENIAVQNLGVEERETVERSYIREGATKRGYGIRKRRIEV